MEAEPRLIAGDILDAFPILENLSIKDCPQLVIAPRHFPSLKELTIKNIYQVSLVKTVLSEVTTLSTLSITGLTELVCVSDVLPIHSNQNLKYLMLKNCPNLISLRGCVSSLKELHIKDCKSLKKLPKDLHNFQFLQALLIDGCHKLKTIKIPDRQRQNTALLLLRICRCNGLVSLQGEMLQSYRYLQVLVVYDCPNLVFFPVDLQQMPSLSVAWISKIPKLSTAPKGFGSLTNLRELSIGPMSDSIELDWLALSSSSVRELILFGLPESSSLPDQLRHLTALTGLELHDFGIVALPDWIGDLYSLEHLDLHNCEELLYLPSTIAIKCLTKLILLRIFCCPLLKYRCTTKSGFQSEWYKISHIPEVCIDGCCIPRG